MSPSGPAAWWRSAPAASSATRNSPRLATRASSPLSMCLKTDQRQGLGTKLMTAMMDDLSGGGLAGYTLWVPATEHPLPARSTNSLAAGLIGQRTDEQPTAPWSRSLRLAAGLDHPRLASAYSSASPIPKTPPSTAALSWPTLCGRSSGSRGGRRELGEDVLHLKGSSSADGAPRRSPRGRRSAGRPASPARCNPPRRDGMLEHQRLDLIHRQRPGPGVDQLVQLGLARARARRGSRSVVLGHSGAHRLAQAREMASLLAPIMKSPSLQR